jgi:RNA polymerase sigma-70 factor (ECF subfamily)
LSLVSGGRKTRVEILAGIDMMRTRNQAIAADKETELTENHTQIFDELMAYQKKVFLICLGFSRNASDAQDLAQEVFLKAYKNIDTLDNLSLSKYWLFRIARNTCLNFRKKHRLDRISAFEMIRQKIDHQDPESQMLHREQLLALKMAIQNLPKKKRDVFVMKEYGDLSYEEIAETLNIKQGTVMSRLNRARQAIKRQVIGD